MKREPGKSQATRNSKHALGLNRALATLIAAGWLLSSLLIGAGPAHRRLQAILALRRQPMPSRQIALLSTYTPLADDLYRLAETLPREAKVFMVTPRLEEYYLAKRIMVPLDDFSKDPGEK